MISANNAAETVTAAANALGLAENRPSAPPTSEKRRWCHCLSIYCCFGSQKNNKRISHATTLLPQTATTSTTSETDPSPSFTIPLNAPPSSPASYLPSETPSTIPSPSPTLLSISANTYSPSGPHSIFAVGPYAHESQLVSPPVFYTEPSTAPFTPPVELTRPSSPEVPFAKLLDLSPRSDVEFSLSQYEFQMYQFYPGSPLGQLISPRSAVSRSGTSSPFQDHSLGFRV